MLKLSPEQKSIVNADLGLPMQVLASAGSGKTRVLTERIRYILGNSKKVGIIAVTFTNKAAEEIRNRLSDIQELDDRCWLATIHSVAQKILEQYGHTIGLPNDLHIFDRDQDRKEVFLQSLRNENIDIDKFLNVEDNRTKKQRERVIQDLLELISSVKRNLLTDEEIIRKYEGEVDFFDYYKAYQKALIEAQGIDYDDILFYAQRILLQQPWCGDIYRSKYKHILVDEAQDLNKAQYELIKAICGESIKSVMLVGDPNQMIYGFNDSSEEYLTKSFVEDFYPNKYILSHNYRSTLAVINAANKIKPGSQTIDNLVLEGQFEITAQQDEQSEAEWICNKIIGFVGLVNDEIEGTISLFNIVVLARNRFVFSELEKILTARNIPFAFKKGERNLEPTTKLGKILDYAIRYKINPKDWVDGKKLCLILSIDIPKIWTSECQLIQFSEIVEEPLIKILLKTIDSLDFDEPNMQKLCMSMIEFIKKDTIETNENEKERSIQEFDNYLTLWTNFKRKGIGQSLTAFRNALSLGQLLDESTNNGLTLSTVHTMKGLENDIVFLMGMCEGVFPDYRAVDKKQLDEELNNMYVAVTRSRRWLYITYPKTRLMPWGDIRIQSPSRYIQLIEEG